MRRLLILVSAVVLVDMSFYAAITPLLPYYVDHEHLTKTSAGVLAGSYAAGTLVGALPSGALAVRFGPRALLVAGLALLSITSLTFGLAHSIVVLDLARFLQGFGGALSWTGGMGWLSSAAPPERRGAMMGTAIAAATAGGLIGPVVGAIARGLGTAPTFGAISAISAVMLVAVAALPIRDVRKVATGPGGLRPALRQPVIARGLWLVACAALMFGALNLLLPLHLDSAGASGALIAFVWLASAAFESIVNPLAGRYADRHGWRGVARAGLLGGAVIVLLAPLPNAVALLALIGILSGPVIGLLWSPAMMLLGEGSDQAGFDHTYAFALMNLAWASAQTVATVGGGALAQATRDVVPLAIVAAVALTTAASLVRARKPVLVREA